MIGQLSEISLEYSSLVSAAATLCGAIATIVIAWFTVHLARENRIIRRMQTTPMVTAFLNSHPAGNGIVNLVIANVGQGPAFDVNFRFKGDGEDFQSHKVMLDFSVERVPFAVIPAGDRITVFLGLGFELFGAGGSTSSSPLKPFAVHVTYSDQDGAKREGSYTLDIRQFDGLAGMIGRPDSARAADALETISKSMPKLLSSMNTLSNELIEATRLRDEFRQYVASRTPDQASQVQKGGKK